MGEHELLHSCQSAVWAAIVAWVGVLALKGHFRLRRGQRWTPWDEADRPPWASSTAASQNTVRVAVDDAAARGDGPVRVFATNDSDRPQGDGTSRP